MHSSADYRFAITLHNVIRPCTLYDPNYMKHFSEDIFQYICRFCLLIQLDPILPLISDLKDEPQSCFLALLHNHQALISDVNTSVILLIGFLRAEKFSQIAPQALPNGSVVGWVYNTILSCLLNQCDYKRNNQSNFLMYHSAHVNHRAGSAI